MAISRRDFARLALGTGAVSALSTLGLTTAGAAAEDYKAVVGVFLYGGNDGWNSLVPLDARYSSTYSLRNSALRIQTGELIKADAATPFGMHPSFAPLLDLWKNNRMSWVMNVGTLVSPAAPLDVFNNAALRPSNLSSHSHEQEHWQSLRPGSVHTDGLFGRMADLMKAMGQNGGEKVAPLMSTNGANLALLGNTSPLILPMVSQFERIGIDDGKTARNAALEAFANGEHASTIEKITAQNLSASYSGGRIANPILVGEGPTGRGAQVDRFFTTGTPFNAQMRMIARMIEARTTFNHTRQIFMAGQGDYDTHANQVAGGRVLGAHADLLLDMTQSVAEFYAALDSLGLGDKVTLFSMSDFGRTYRGNESAGSDHAWGNNHFIVGGGAHKAKVHGAYPKFAMANEADPAKRGDAIEAEGTFIPTIANEEYVGAVAKWFGVPDANMSAVLPNWSRWSTSGRGAVPIFG